MGLDVGSCFQKLYTAIQDLVNIERSLLKSLSPISDAKIRSVLSKNFHFILEEKIQTMLQNLETESLPKIKAIKEEAEMRFRGENQSLIMWLWELDDVICEAEDVLDEYKYKHLEQQVQRKQHAFVRSFYSYTSHVHYVSRVEAILKRLDQFSSRVDDFIKLIRSDYIDGNKGTAHTHACAGVVTTSWLYEQVFGRDEEIKHVIKLLLCNDDQSYQILPIIGVGGVGKTVLAKSVYNHPEIERHFDQRIWVYVPEDFDEVNITTSMVELASNGTCPDTKNLDELQKLLKDHVRDKRVLLVLDDVWYDEKSTELANKVRWMRLLAPLEYCHPGSMILVTSRMKLVAKIFANSIEPVVLKGLEEDDCFALFNRYLEKRVKIVALADPETPDEHLLEKGKKIVALADPQTSDKHLLEKGKKIVALADPQTPDEHLLEMGKKIVAEIIVARFSGLPLAVMVVAGMLRQMFDAEEWKYILRSDNAFQDVIKILMVSYQRLPQHLQRYVAHHSIFPKGMALSREYLIHSWIGDGLIIDLAEENNGLTVEDIASAYLNELVSRSFFQCRDDGLFVLDGLMHDVADFVTNDVCTRIEHDTRREIPPTIKHLRIDMERLAEYKKKICKLKNLRTLVFTCKSSGIEVPIDNELLGKTLKKAKRLRVLRLASCHIDQLPEWLGDLHHLRLLDLSDLQVKRLPRSVCRLYHLLYLDLMNFKADNMPGSLSKLINLRRIISDAATLDRFGKIGELTALQQLPLFSIKKKEGHKIGELKKLNKLRGELRISNLQNVSRSKELAGAKLKKKTCLHKLYLEWNNNGGASASETMEKVLDELQPPHQINDLEIVGYTGKRPPIWMQISVQHSLPCLKVLILNQWLGTLPLLDQWVPQLHQLELRKCSKLRCLPPLPLNLEKLLLSGCYLLAIITEADLVKGYAQEMKAGYDSRSVAVIEEEVRIQESLKKNNRAMAKLELQIQSLEASGYDLKPSAVGYDLEPSASSYDIEPSSSRLASLQSWGLSRKHDAIREKLTTKMQSIDRNVQPLPSSLTQLHLSNCFVDDSELLNCISKLTLLTHLVLAGCYCITSLPSEEVLSKLTLLQELRIEDCVLLTSLGGLGEHPSLRVLNIWSCPNLLALILSEGSSSALLPESLTDLAITDCELMTNELVSRCLRGLTRLKHLSLQQLKHITSFPSDDELSHLTSIESLTLKDCEKLVSMGGLHMLSSLSSLHVQGCLGLLESGTGDGPLSDSVPNITVDNISLMQALLSRKGLSSLQVLSIIGQDVPFTPEQEECLKHLTSLQTLSFKNCKSLSSLPSNLECLTSLKRLYIENCPQMNSITTLPTSFQIILDGSKAGS
ncbi:putative disease resistance RPP13-like protein 1 [Dioscorea cayenensis subsp. rotundata]|uniref:Disease resistance RPP13-like protein 1 n=1 Tax=Dioscorea cayennensis subsp. rotundata TaxID=55577 RepID=A0AB40CW26_DIOCR|nr:putative disease resistance RPP13-like protein 1 [Dioscorea cayenensis subsp. rotundata]